jgi:hypothetical protein
LNQEFADLRANVRPVFDAETIDIAQGVVAEAASGSLSQLSLPQLAGAILDAAGPVTPAQSTPSAESTPLRLVKPDG